MTDIDSLISDSFQRSPTFVVKAPQAAKANVNDLIADFYDATSGIMQGKHPYKAVADSVPFSERGNANVGYGIDYDPSPRGSIVITTRKDPGKELSDDNSRTVQVAYDAAAKTKGRVDGRRKADKAAAAKAEADKKAKMDAFMPKVSDEQLAKVTGALGGIVDEAKAKEAEAAADAADKAAFMATVDPAETKARSLDDDLDNAFKESETDGKVSPKMGTDIRPIARSESSASGGDFDWTPYLQGNEDALKAYDDYKWVMADPARAEKYKDLPAGLQKIYQQPLHEDDPRWEAIAKLREQGIDVDYDKGRMHIMGPNKEAHLSLAEKFLPDVFAPDRHAAMQRQQQAQQEQAAKTAAYDYQTAANKKAWDANNAAFYDTLKKQQAADADGKGVTAPDFSNGDSQQQQEPQKKGLFGKLFKRSDINSRMSAWHQAGQHPERASEFLKGGQPLTPFMNREDEIKDVALDAASGGARPPEMPYPDDVYDHVIETLQNDPNPAIWAYHNKQAALEADAEDDQDKEIEMDLNRTIDFDNMLPENLIGAERPRSKKMGREEGRSVDSTERERSGFSDGGITLMDKAKKGLRLAYDTGVPMDSQQADIAAGAEFLESANALLDGYFDDLQDRGFITKDQKEFAKAGDAADLSSYSKMARKVADDTAKKERADSIHWGKFHSKDRNESDAEKKKYAGISSGTRDSDATIAAKKKNIRNQTKAERGALAAELKDAYDSDLTTKGLYEAAKDVGRRSYNIPGSEDTDYYRAVNGYLAPPTPVEEGLKAGRTEEKYADYDELERKGMEDNGYVPDLDSHIENNEKATRAPTVQQDYDYYARHFNPYGYPQKMDRVDRLLDEMDATEGVTDPDKIYDEYSWEDAEIPNNGYGY